MGIQYLSFPSSLVRYVRWKCGFCRRLRAHPPVFVYQMGKVSSRSVYEPLGCFYKGGVIHDHVYGVARMQGETRELNAYLESPAPPSKVYIISLVREPIIRNISSFFANYEKYTGQPAAQADMRITDLKEIFLQKFPHDQPLNWYDYSVKPHFGIDVYSKPCLPDGYVTYERDNISMLVMQMELDDSVKSELVRDFLKLKEFKVSRANETAGKAYGDIYKRFKAEIRFPAPFVDSFCESRYFRHFYSPAFIEETRKRWTEEPKEE